MMKRFVITVLLLLLGTSAQADLFNKSYAVVIGISSYQNGNKWKKLDNAENDAKAMDDFFTGQGFEVKRFVGRQATRDNIIAYLEDTLARNLVQGDRFIFYFSGHGNTLLRGGSDWGYLIPYDGDAEKSSTWIDMKQLRDLAEKFGNARHQLFILDACFGGLFATKSSNSSIPVGTPSYIAEVTARRARQYLTAGGVNEVTPACSNLDGYRQYSYYTAYLLKGLREGAADTYPDGFITASELDAYLGPAAKTEYNTPSGGNFPGHEQGNFVFHSPKPAQIVSNLSMVPGPTKGNDKNSYEVERLRAELDRLRAADKAQELKQKSQRTLQSQPVSYSEQPVSARTVSKEQQAQALYEWQQDIQFSESSHVVEKFLKDFPVGSHVSDAQRRLQQLHAQGK